MVAREKPSDATVETASGLIVPASAVAVDGPIGKAVDQAVADVLRRRVRTTAYDPDGRRRIVLSRRERAVITKAAGILTSHGIALLLACGFRFDESEACRGFLVPERKGQTDEGFGCSCGRVHFVEGI